ncbi:MAG: outer membrane lipoprotein-sorting protein [Puniceicoccales bacterium]|jgi:hypothetical protein|nr:outer membrane lipoprotein-sorting protein [Puniceicoccales bacterium]
MKAPRSARFAIATACFALICSPVCGRDLHVLSYMSDARAQEFLENVRKNSAQISSQWRCKVKLYDPLNASSKKFGELIFAPTKGQKTFSINFGGARCIMSDGELENIEPSAFEVDEPFFENLILSPRDLLFIFADDEQYSYVGPMKVASRSMQQFSRQIDLRIGGVKFSSMKIFIDEKLMIILRVDLMVDRRQVGRRISIGSFKNFDGVWIPKIIEISDIINHRRTKLEILSAELDS